MKNGSSHNTIVNRAIDILIVITSCIMLYLTYAPIYAAVTGVGREALIATDAMIVLSIITFPIYMLIMIITSKINIYYVLPFILMIPAIIYKFMGYPRF